MPDLRSMPVQDGGEDEGSALTYSQQINAPLRPETIAALARELAKPYRARYVRRNRVPETGHGDETRDESTR